MSNKNVNILVVDDEPKNLKILKKYLSDSNYNTVEASDGIEAWSILQQPSHKFDAILLDRMMPNMDGMEVLKKVKQHPELRTIPVIMQTAMVEKNDVLAGVQAGCYYYLTKPYEENILMSIVGAAVADYQNINSLQEEMRQRDHTMRLLESGRFNFRTLEEGRDLATLLAAICPDSNMVSTGLYELIINAIEHGNLGISYAEKTTLLVNDVWQDEIEKRLSLPEYASRYVSLEFQKSEDEISFVIKDNGEGFDWQQYLEFSPERATHCHGRGIAMANAGSFDYIEYLGNGNEVKATIHANEKWVEL